MIRNSRDHSMSRAATTADAASIASNPPLAHTPRMKPDGGVQLGGVTVRYGRRTRSRAYRQFAPGSLTAVVGANGAGKSTLLAAIAGTVRLARGAVACPARAQGRLAFLPQLAAIDRDYPLTVAELIALGGWREIRRVPRARRRAPGARGGGGGDGRPGRAAAPAIGERIVGGRISARAVRPPDPAGRRGDPARRTVRRGRCRRPRRCCSIRSCGGTRRAGP